MWLEDFLYINRRKLLQPNFQLNVLHLAFIYHILWFNNVWTKQNCSLKNWTLKLKWTIIKVNWTKWAKCILSFFVFHCRIVPRFHAAPVTHGVTQDGGWYTPRPPHLYLLLSLLLLYYLLFGTPLTPGDANGRVQPHGGPERVHGRHRPGQTDRRAQQWGRLHYRDGGGQLQRGRGTRPKHSSGHDHRNTRISWLIYTLKDLQSYFSWPKIKHCKERKFEEGWLDVNLQCFWNVECFYFPKKGQDM